MATIRYIVEDVDEAVAFYTQHLRFEIAMQPPTGFAMLARDDLRLLLNRPGAGEPEGRITRDGSRSPAVGTASRSSSQTSRPCWPRSPMPACAFEPG